MSAALPIDPASCGRLLLAERAAHADTRLKLDQANAKLQALIKRYFGRSSEKLDPNQIAFAWAAVQADHAMTALPAAAPTKAKASSALCQAGPADGGICP